MEFTADEGEKNICRMCLGKVKNYAMSLFHNFQGTGLPIFSHIMSIANVIIIENDDYPQIICSPCLSELEVALTFKKKCEKSNMILQIVAPNVFILEPNDLTVKLEELVETDHTTLEDMNTSQFDDTSDDKNYLVFKAKNEDESHNALFDTSPAIDDTTDTRDYGDDDDGEILLKHVIPKPQFKSKAIDLHLQCDDCKNFFKSKCKLRVHWKRVHMRQQLICQTCKRDFKELKSYMNHKKVRPRSCIEASNFRIEGLGKCRTIYCKECSYKTKRMRDMIAHKVTHTGERPYACDKCGKTHTQLSSLINHNETAHGEYKVEITCQYCGKNIKGRGKVYRHLKKHTNNTTQCKICAKTFKNINTLRGHMLRHQGVKKVQCELCEKKFFTKSECTTHKKTVHLDSRSMYSCDLCGYESSYKLRIKRHRSQHVGHKLPCTLCGRFYDSEKKLRIHKSQHFTKNLVCDHCDTNFTRRDNLITHIRLKHMDKSPKHLWSGKKGQRIISH